MDEIAAVHAYYGQAVANGFDIPEYEVSAAENFIFGPDSDRSLENVFETLEIWGLLDRVDSQRGEPVYRMTDEVAKVDAEEVWGVVEQEYGGSVKKFLEDFDTVEEEVSVSGFPCGVVSTSSDYS
ncbi:MAG: hypothetical protein ACLFRK_03515 [Candidatus Nanohaloarchaea archaeon]